MSANFASEPACQAPDHLSKPKECRALLEDRMSIENEVPPDGSYARIRDRN